MARRRSARIGRRRVARRDVERRDVERRDVERRDVERRDVERRGVDVPATLAGMLAAVGFTVLLGGLAAGVGSVGYQAGVPDERLSAAGVGAGLVVLLAAFVAGGWVAGRMARFDGIRNGVLSAAWFLLVMLVLSLVGWWAGDRWRVLDRVRLPQWFDPEQWFDPDRTGVQAIGSALLGALVIVAGAALGGWLGERYHRRVDQGRFDRTVSDAAGEDVCAGGTVVTGTGGTDISKRGQRGESPHPE